MLERQKLFEQELREKMDGFAERGLHPQAVLALVKVLRDEISGRQRTRTVPFGDVAHRLISLLFDLMEHDGSKSDGQMACNIAETASRNLRTVIKELALDLEANLPEFKNMESKFTPSLSQISIFYH